MPIHYQTLEQSHAFYIRPLWCLPTRSNCLLFKIQPLINKSLARSVQKATFTKILFSVLRISLLTCFYIAKKDQVKLCSLATEKIKWFCTLHRQVNLSIKGPQFSKIGWRLFRQDFPHPWSTVQQIPLFWKIKQTYFANFYLW